MSSQNIPLKVRSDSRDPAEFWPQRLFAFEVAAFSALSGGFLRFPIGDRRCNRTRASVGNAGGNARGFIGIVELPSLPEDPAYRCMQRLGQPLAETTEESFDKIFAINTRGLAFTVKKALLLLNDGEAIIVCVPPSRGGASTG